MNINTNGDYNPCQLNETINLSPSGQILSRSLMLNLRGETAKEVWKAYRGLKKLIDSKEDKPEKKARKVNKQTKKEQKKDNPGTCPKCSAFLIHRSGIGRNGRAYNFLGCSSFPICTYTRNIPEAERDVPCVEDLMTIEER